MLQHYFSLIIIIINFMPNSPLRSLSSSVLNLKELLITLNRGMRIEDHYHDDIRIITRKFPIVLRE